MSLARFVAAPDGTMVAVLTPTDGTGHALPPAENELDVDPETNPVVMAAIDTDSRSLRLVGGVLTRNGAPVAVNPPGAAEQERLTPATASAVLAQLQAFRDAPAPTAAQQLAALKLVCRILQFLIRRLVT